LGHPHSNFSSDLSTTGFKYASSISALGNVSGRVNFEHNASNFSCFSNILALSFFQNSNQYLNLSKPSSLLN